MFICCSIVSRHISLYPNVCRRTGVFDTKNPEIPQPHVPQLEMNINEVRPCGDLTGIFCPSALLTGNGTIPPMFINL